jgi:tagaturonate reductase
VDRIVSGYPWERAQDLETTLGYQDKLLVAGEYYHSWVIQGPKTVEQELPFSKTNLNVQFVNDLVPHPEMKVRILNGAHTALVPIGYLAGFRTVKEAMENPIIRDFVKSLLIDETISTLDIPEVVKKKFLEDVLDRFYNPFLKHNLTSISLNSTSKFVTCLLPTLKDYYGSEGNLPRRIVFILSALIRFYKGEYNEETIEIQDDKYVIKFFRSVWMDYNSINITLLQMVQTILENSKIWGEDLTLLNGLSESVISDLESIEKNGIKGSLLKKFSK